MIVIAVYKKHEQETNEEDGAPVINNHTPTGREEQARSSRKPFVWIHPPKDLELSVTDELFVLCDKNPQDII